MAWSFEIPGQPPSWNHSYRIVHRKVQDRFGQPVLDQTGRPMKQSTLAKTATVKEYQDMVHVLAMAARPPSFQPRGQLYVIYQYQLARDMDCDNIQKAINDAISRAIGINDRKFLPVALSKTTGNRNPSIRITIADATEVVLSLQQVHP